MNINNLTKKELLIKCEELGIIKCKSKNKTELINLINNNIKIEHEIDDISDKIIKENNYYIGDNIELLKNIDDEIVDLIYFDPPYNTGRNFYDFNDKFKSKDEYIQFIKLRISECNRILKKSGTLVIHIEPKISHYFRFICDGYEKQWYVTKEKMEVLHNENRLEYNKDGLPRIKRFLDEMEGIPLRDIWCDISNIQNNEKLNYATQKPVKLVERIIELYTNENDLCLDIFAGSGTLGRACINKKRKYILFDINIKGKEIFLENI